MVGIIKEIDGQKKIVPLTTDTGTGAPVGTLIQQYKKVPMSGYLYCDGSTFDENDYPALYMYLGTNVLPDYRECVMVGAEQNTTDTIATHDVYGEGEFKDDQLQDHRHSITPFKMYNASGSWTGQGIGIGNTGTTVHDSLTVGNTNNARTGDTNTTHGKQKAVYVYIKATSGLAENQQENVLNDVKGYVDSSNSYSTDEVKTGGKWIDGRPIYKKTIDCGALPNNAIKNVAHNITDLDLVTKCYGGARHDTYRILLPNAGNVSSSTIEVYVNDTDIVIHANSDRSKYNGYVTIEYTKTTD